MVIFYDLKTKNILYTEQEKMIPELPFGTTKEKIDILAKEGKGFIGVPYELGMEVVDYKVVFSKGEFVGIQPKNK